MAPASAVWFDAGEDVCVGCSYPTRWHFDQTKRWVGCNGAERVFQLRHRLAQQLASSIHQSNQERQREGVRHARSLRPCGPVR